ncbi:MAG: type IV pilus assembly protein PilX [Motiliproteus sp.]
MMSHAKQKQQGIALIISMIVLLVITLLGLGSVRDASMEEKMAGNIKSRTVAFQAAESALREAEHAIPGMDPDAFDGSGGLYPPLTEAWTTNAASWASSSLVRHYGGTLAGVAAAPVYIIEALESGISPASVEAGQPSATSGGYYRITARAVGSSDTAVVVLQTVYKN